MVPRPRPSKPQPTQLRIVEEKQTDPQVAFLVHREVMEKFTPGVREALEQFMGCSLFIDFCKLNVAQCEQNMKDLRPMGNWTPEQFTNLSKDMRLVWRFWTDLLQFAEEFKS